MVLNLLQRHSLDKARELVQRSFGRYLAGLDLVDDEEVLSQLRLQLSQLDGVAGDVPWEDFEDYEKSADVCEKSAVC
jgi:superfamily II RNA helicase